MLPPKVARFVSVLFARNLDLNTPEGRSQDRYRRAAWTSLTLITARLVNIATGLATIPLMADYLGKYQFGLWMALTGFVAFLQFTDMGLGEGLQNSLIRCNGQDDFVTPTRLVTTALSMMCALALLIVAFAFLLLPYVPLDRLTIIDDAAARAQLLPTAQAICCAFALGLPAALFQRMCDAYQRGYIGWGLMLLGRIGGFISVLICIWLKTPLWMLAGLYMGIPFVTLLLGSPLVFWRMPWLVPGLDRFCRASASKIISIGGQSVVIRFSYALMNSAPPLIILNRIGADEVGQLTVTQRLLGAMGILTVSAVASLRGAYGEAALRGDWEWIKRTLRQLLKVLTVIYAVSGLILAIVGQRVILWWTGEEFTVPSDALLYGCLVFVTAQAFNGVLQGCLFSLNCLRAQAVYYFVTGLVAVVGMYSAIPYWGLAAAYWIVAVCETSKLICLTLDVRHAFKYRRAYVNW